MTFFGELFFNGAVPERATPSKLALARTQIRKLEEETCTDARRREGGACFSNCKSLWRRRLAPTLRAAEVNRAGKGKLQPPQSRAKPGGGLGAGAGLAGAWGDTLTRFHRWPHRDTTGLMSEPAPPASALARLKTHTRLRPRVWRRRVSASFSNWEILSSPHV
jgi:hypothetical protein